MKKIIAGIMAICLCCGAFAPISNYSLAETSVTACAADYTEGTYGSLSYEKYSDHIVISDCDEEAKGELVIPDTIEGLPVTVIRYGAFRRCSSLTSITIPDSVIEIGWYAFDECKSLTSIIIPDSITEIGGYAFNDCKSLTSITIPNSVTEIGEGAFNDCKSLTSITIPNSVTEIGEGAFERCSNLPSITIPNSVTEIGKSAFEDCTSLTSVTIPESVECIGNGAFRYCSSLTSINVSENNKNYVSLDGIIFDKKQTTIIAYPAGKKDNEYVIPDNITNIANSAFYGCSNLESIMISDNVTNIGSEAFNICSSLKNVKIPDNVTNIGSYAFANCLRLKNVTIPDNVTSIGKYAFNGTYYFNNLKYENGFCITPNNILLSVESDDEEITVPDNVKLIASGAFYNLECTSVIINSSCIINDSAFWSCDNLKSVKVNGNFIGDKIAGGCFSLTNLTYERDILKYNISDNEENKVNIADSYSIEIENVEYDTYDNITSYQGYKGHLDKLHETADTSGNIYAVYGYKDRITVVPETPTKNSFEIANEGFTFGAAVIGDDDHLYAVWGKDISDDVIADSLDEENIVICKYDLTGKLIDSLGLPVKKTKAQFPFASGNANIDYSNGFLAVLIDTKWISHHQGSDFIAVDAETMQTKYIDTLSVSHCFGVSMIPTDYGFAAVQRSDDGPRGIALTRHFIEDNFDDLGDKSKVNVYHCSGQYGTNAHHLDGNYTYTYMGGLAKSESTYAVVGRSERVYTSDIYKSSGLQTGNYDVFVKIADRTLFDSAAQDCAGEDRIDVATGEAADKNIIWLTECNETEKAGNAKVVTLEDGSYCVLWEKFVNDEFDSIRYVIMDECGNILRRETEISGARLSNTSIQPIVQDSTLKWAVAYEKTNSIVWYSVDLNKYYDEIVYGDANCDGNVTIADSTAILQHLGNEDKYGLSDKGKKNADVDGEKGVTGNDAIMIQMVDAKLISVDELGAKK